MDKIAIFYDNATYKNKIEYIFNYIFSHYFVKEKKIELVFNPLNDNQSFIQKIYYQDKKIDNIFYIKPQRLIFSDNPINSHDLIANEYLQDEMSLYSVERDKSEKKHFIVKREIQFDMIETIFFHISRYEEYHANQSQLDHHQRMKSSEQFLVKHKLYKIPVVDHIVYMFLKQLGFNDLNIKTIYSMTHDIDAIRKYPSFYKFSRALARVAIKEKKVSKVFNLVKQYLQVKITKKDTYDTFDWLLLENKSKEKSIYFMSGGKTKYDNFYSIYDDKLQGIFKLARDNNYTIGLHPSYSTPFEKKQFKKEIDILEKVIDNKIDKARQHILHYSVKETLDILEELDIKFDSTFGYQDLVGFRCGTGHNYYLYNFNKEKQSSVQEIPLVVMDGPLLMESDYDVLKAEKIIFDFIERNKKITKVTFNFHNSTFDDMVCDSKLLKKLYININDFFEGNIE